MPNERPYDFSGWATVTGVKCSDGRTIAENAFADGIAKKRQVPLVWAHQHKDPQAVLGHAILENRQGGVYAYGYLNDTDSGKHVRTCLENGDIEALSIWANNLQHSPGRVVTHGEIQELSVVLAGANKAALVDNVIVHDGIDELGEDGTMYVYSPNGEIALNEDGELYHSDEDSSKNSKSTKEDEQMPTETKEPKPLTAEEIKAIIAGMTEDQQRVLYGLVGMAATTAKKSKGDDEMPRETVQHNLFAGENNVEYITQEVLAHDVFQPVMDDFKHTGSLRDAWLAHAEEFAAEYGIDSIDYLFPEYKDVNGFEPSLIKRDDGWVGKVLNGVHRTPFAKIRMMFADITGDEARAKGYLKGNLKKEEVFGLLKRVIDATTIYKKQKLNKDDIRDITNFNVVVWIKREMRIMLNEEIARASVFGDGRSALSEDKIDESRIIPIIKDTKADFYAMKAEVTAGDDESVSHAIIRTAIKSQDEYEGSGNTTFFTSPSTVSDMLLMEDGFGHRLYKDVKDIALALGVNEVVKVPKTIIDAASNGTNGLYGVIVDLKDYNIGADNGGDIDFFDDFDIDYNQEKYLMETRCSGGLTRYHSAIVLGSAAFLATLPN